MRIAETLLPEFEQEMASTRRLLERVPSDKGPWKPHPRSFAVGHLAQLVSWMPGWIGNTLRAKLTVDLRLLDVPIPPIYGPTADERSW